MNLKVDLAFSKEEGLKQLIGGNKMFVLSDKYLNEEDLIKRSYIITFQFNHLLIRVSWTPDPKVQVLNFPLGCVYRIHPQDSNESIIQVIRGCVFKDISQFHFKATKIVEENVADKMVSNRK